MIELLDQEYELIRDDDCFDIESVKEKITDYFVDYDYLCGDYSYDKLRLKGFYDSNNKKVREFNDIKGLSTYISDYCSYGAKIFLLKKRK